MFNISWENELLFAEIFFGKAECLICQRSLACRKFILKRHYYLCHQEYDNVKGDDRETLVIGLKKKFYEKMIEDSMEQNESNIRAERTN